MDEGPLPDMSLPILDSTLVDGNIFLRATSHLARADNGILQQKAKGLIYNKYLYYVLSCVIL